ncbi:MAG: hypothetical protein ACRDTG_09260 [Pseudonocardiaceae bacterium]
MINTDGDGAGAAQSAELESFAPPELTQPASSEVGPVAARSAVTGRHYERAEEGPVHLEHARKLREHRARNTELNLRRWFGYILLGALIGVPTFVNIVFVIYLTKNDWHIDALTLQAWLVSAAAEVLGLVGVVVKYLFSPDAVPR